MNKEFYLEHNFYSPSIQATSVKKLYENVKNRGITMKQVKEFIQKQEAHQLFQNQNQLIIFQSSQIIKMKSSKQILWMFQISQVLTKMLNIF